MSIKQEGDRLSPPILHFINTPNKTESSPTNNDENKVSSPDENKTDVSPVHENNTEQSPNNENRITTASHTRRVHFPTDDSQLRIISYAPEPLSNQPLVSLGMILQRYRAACLRLQLLPLNILLDQLSTMDDGRKSFYDRLDCLKIVNEKIDLKHIDAIEEILSRCRFHTLDFESSSIDDTALTQLFDVIEYYESCTHINLSNNRSIGTQGYQALTKYLRKTSSLERLDMNSMRFDDDNVLSFLRTCTSLRELYLCDNRMYYLILLN
jgi:protein phosphatase 1 regulatory subunit 37